MLSECVYRSGRRANRATATVATVECIQRQVKKVLFAYLSLKLFV